jgi:cell division protein FtsI (penicillin-binding protein 3)
MVIVDVATGEILALANWPTYNPNRRDKVARERMRNRALTDVFEPGSTLKPFTIAGRARRRQDPSRHRDPDRGGTWQVGPNTIHDAHAEGALTVEQVIQKSSNVGAAKIALGLAPELDVGHVLRRGLRHGAQDRFPRRVAGRLRPAKTWRPIEQATMAYGHGISVNLVQLARAYTIFATDGEVKPVTLLKTDGPRGGKTGAQAGDRPRRSQNARDGDEAGGTAPKAQVIGYRVAGKTGTAHKLEGRGYAPNKYVSSFVGFAPASAPRLIVAVMIDEPAAGQYYGGAVAAPGVLERRRRALAQLGVPTDAR